MRLTARENQGGSVLDGITFIKPAPAIGKPSEFFINGRPRRNSSGITKCPPIAITFPSFDASTWQRFRDHLPTHDFFKATYPEWIRFRQEQEKELTTPTEPFVAVNIDFDAWMTWCKTQHNGSYFAALCEYANTIFSDSLRRLADEAQSRENALIVVPRYMLLVTEEIGQDKANDLSSIYLVDEGITEERRNPLIENERLFFEHGLALASAFAVKLGVHAVRYEKDMTNAWV
jgi:hypothetical protein